MTVELDDVLDDVPMIRSVCQESLYEFVKEFWGEIEAVPYVDSWHVGAICEHLQAVTEGQISRLLVNIPPGCSKSLLTCVFWPMWEWTRDASIRWFFASYDQALSTRDSVRCRALMSSDRYQSMWGDRFFIVHDSNQKTYYATNRGGYRMATSTGGHGTGEHPDRIVFDDVHKVSGAESELERHSVIEWNDLTMSTRGIARNARRVIIMQRLHPKDLSGHILAKGGYVHICLPMEYERNRMVATPLGWNDPRREEGELLTPLFSPSQVEDMKSNLGMYGTAGQLQQRPSPREGGLFKAPWFRNRVRAAPYVAKRIRFWDRAATLDGGCATAGVLMCKAGDRYYVEHVVYGQWAPYERNQTIVATANRDRNRYGPENDPIIYIESERGSTGLESFQYLAAQLAGFRIKEDNPKGSKDVRAEPLADQFAAGNMYLVEDGTWDVEAYVEEFLLFKPDVTVKRLGGMKDRVDGSSGAFNLLSGLKPTASLRVVDLNVSGKKSVRRVVVGTEEDLQHLRIDRQSLLVTVTDPLAGEPLPHSLELLVGSLELRFADLVPEDYQDCWDLPFDPYNRKPSELVMSRDDGRKLWSIILKRRDPAWDALVLRGPLRVTLAIAVAVCESLNLPVAQTIYLPRDPDYKCDGAKDVENKHVYSLVKSSRFLVVD